MPKQNPYNSREFPVSVLQWDGMKSAMPLPAIPMGALSYSLNMDYFDLNTLQSRGGTRVWNPNTNAGAHAAIGGFEFSITGSNASTGLKATSNGKLLSFSSTIVAADIILGSLTTTSVLKRVKFAQFLDKIYIADGFSAWEWEPIGGLTAIDKVATLGIALTDRVFDVINHNNRLWFLCSGGQLLGSGTNDATDFTSAAAWNTRIGRGDGMENSNMVSWFNTLLITKESIITHKSCMYRLTGSAVADFTVDPLYSSKDTPTGFLGSSATLIGNDVIGLTRGGFTTISAIQNFAEATVSGISKDIRDFVRRVNFSRSDLITGIFDTINEQYLCACPLDNADYNGVVFVYDVANQRWGLYDNWQVSTFFNMGGKVYFGDINGNIIQTQYGYNDQGNGYRKIVETGNMHLDAPDVIKMFKQIDVDIAQNGSYNVDITPIVDDQDLSATPIPVSVTGGSLWDVFVWDRDPWDSSPSTKRTIYLLKRGKMLRLRFSNSGADQPWALRSLTLRTIKTDAGQMQLPS